MTNQQRPLNFLITIATSTNSVRSGAGVKNIGETLSNGVSGAQAPKLGVSGGPGAGKRFPESVKNAARAQSNGTCVFCGENTTKSPGPKQSNIDHAQPKSREGNNSLDNAQNTCRDCNLEKGAKTTEEFLSK